MIMLNILASFLLSFFLNPAYSQSEVCQSKLQNLSDQLRQFPRQLPSNITDLSVVMFSGKDIYDMGSKELCDLNSELHFILATPYQPSYMGVCIYKECSVEALNNITNQMTSFLPFTVEFYDDSLNEQIKHRHYSGFIATCVIIGVLLICGFIGVIVQYTSLFDYRNQHHPAKQRTPQELLKSKHKCGLFFLSFSFPLNFHKLVSTDSGGDAYDTNLDIFAGVRTLSMMYIILSHLVGATFISRNFEDLLRATSTWYGVFAFGGSYAVDAFFCIAGFLGTYTLLFKLSKSNRICFNFPLVYFHRWYRLVPTLAFVILLNMYLFPFLIEGPVAISFYYLSVQNCNKYWWPNLLFINNFYPWDVQSECLAQSWYLANDFQFFLLLPFLLLLMRFHKYLAYSINVLLILLSILACFVIAYSYKIYLPNTADHYTDDYYIKPYCRLGAYMIGVLLGQLYYDRKIEIQENIRDDQTCGILLFRFYDRYSLAGWISAIVGLFLTSFIIFFYKTAYPCGRWGLLFSVVWIALSRPLFVNGMMLVLLPTFEGKLPWIKSFLSCRLFKILGKLTYSAFLIHGVIAYAYFGSEQNTELSSRDRSAFLFFGLYCLDYIASVFIYLLCELPTSNLEKTLFFPHRASSSSEVYLKPKLNEEERGLVRGESSDELSSNQVAINRVETSISGKNEEESVKKYETQ